MTLSALPALAVQPAQNNAVQNYQASNAAATQQAMLKRQEAAKGIEGLAAVSLGVLGGRLDGQPDPQKWEQALDMMAPAMPPGMIDQLRGKPELARTIAQGSMDVLKYVQDEKMFDLQMKKMEQDIQAAAAKASAPIEVSGGATMWDPVTKQPLYTAPPAGPTTIVNTGDNGGTNAAQFQKDLGGLQAKRYDQMLSDAQAAQTSIGSLTQMEQAISDPKFYSGVGADQIMQLKRMAQTLGIDPGGVTSMESFNALNKQSALAAMGGSLGAGFSNADRDFVVEQVPSFANTKEGNQKLIAIQKKIAQRKIEIADKATAYVQEHGVLDANFNAELADWAKANPLFADEAKATENGNGQTDKITSWDDPSMDWGL